MKYNEMYSAFWESCSKIVIEFLGHQDDRLPDAIGPAKFLATMCEGTVRVVALGHLKVLAEPGRRTKWKALAVL